MRKRPDRMYHIYRHSERSWHKAGSFFLNNKDGGIL